MLTPAEAEQLILGNLVPLPSEDCPLAEAHGRVLRGAVCADRDLPPFDRVTMDGYAVRAAALAAGTRTFRVEGIQAAGMIPQKLGPGPDACVEIMTGAVLPIGADCVVPYEETTRAGEVMTVTAVNFSAGLAVAPFFRGLAAGLFFGGFFIFLRVEKTKGTFLTNSGVPFHFISECLLLEVIFNFFVFFLILSLKKIIFQKSDGVLRQTRSGTVRQRQIRPYTVRFSL